VNSRQRTAIARLSHQNFEQLKTGQTVIAELPILDLSAPQVQERGCLRFLAPLLLPPRLADPGLEPFLAALAPPFDFALSFRRHRNPFRPLSCRRAGSAALA
jgi:hypothetical protein